MRVLPAFAAVLLASCASEPVEIEITGPAYSEPAMEETFREACAQWRRQQAGESLTLEEANLASHVGPFFPPESCP